MFVTAHTSNYFLRYEIQGRAATAYPLNWNAVFGRQAALFVEIGFGNGEFLVDWARANPEHNFVGIELSMESARRIQKKIYALKVTNIRIIRDHARFVLRELFPNNSIRGVVMNFPDPWPKKRHQERRLIDTQFVRILSAVTQTQGYFELVTDQFWYAQQAREKFMEENLFETTEIITNPVRSVSTKYERKWRSEGRDIFQMIATQRHSVSINRLLEDVTMPHVFISPTIRIDKLEPFLDRMFREGESSFLVKRIYQDLNKRNFLLRAITRDLDYLQNFYIIIARHEDGWIIKLDDSLQPYRTPAVKWAIQKIGEILQP